MHSQQLKDGTPVRLDTVAEAHVEEMRRIFNAIVLDGATYPQERALDDAAFRAYYLSHDAFCVRLARPAWLRLDRLNVY